jgi:REP element-mobilizing transposase RayT
MARNIRLEFEGAFYHVMARGNRRGPIFVDEQDRRFFLQCLADVCERTGWLVHAWVLMDNHYHLFIQTPEPNLVEGMKWFQNTVTRRFNVRHREWGRLFGDRYKAVVVDGESRYYYETLWDYIHLNPGRAGLVDVTRGQSVLDYPWSSLAGGYALMPHQRAKWLAAESGLATMGVEDTAEGRKMLVERLDKRVAEERERSGFVAVEAGVDRRGSHLRRGWYWGKQAFAEKLMKLGKGVLDRERKARGYDASPERQAHGEQKALELLEEGLRVANLSADELPGHRCTEPRKVLLAALLWKRTTVSQAWIAEHLGMKNAANVSRVIHGMEGSRIEKRVPAELWSLFSEKEEKMNTDPQF